VSGASLTSPTLNTVAKFDDSFIRALQIVNGPESELRVTPSSSPQKLFARYTRWGMYPYAGYTNGISTRLTAQTPPTAGLRCYDNDSQCPFTDHFCLFMQGSSSAHVCIRRFNTAGLFFNGSGFPGTYLPATIWVR
jgi:hypothetical protein